MNITTNHQTPSFGLSINKSKMNSRQVNIANRLAKGVITSQEYVPLDKLELIFLPKGNTSSIVVKVLDLISGKFLTDNNKKTLEKTVGYNSNSLEAGDAVIEFYKKASKLERPKVDDKSILAGKTYLQKNLLPESGENISNFINNFKDIIGIKSATAEAINSEYHNDIPEEGFDIDF